MLLLAVDKSFSATVILGFQIWEESNCGFNSVSHATKSACLGRILDLGTREKVDLRTPNSILIFPILSDAKPGYRTGIVILSDLA